MLQRVRPLPLAVGGIALVAALLRLPFLRYPATLDGGGFYLVGRSWLHGGPSLYGRYWVDRPPGLIGIFGFASATGHFVTIRLIVLLAVVVLILAVARVAHVLGGSAIWAAAVAACLTLTPQFGAELEPGELLACSVSSVAFLAAVEARRTTGRRALLLAAAAGLLGVAAASVKQNFLDGLVATAVLFGVDALLRTTDRRQAIRMLLAAGCGTVLGGLIVLVISMVAMTGPGALFNALVTFRIDAGSVLAHSPGDRLSERLAALNHRALWSGLLPLVIVLLVAALRRVRTPSAPVLAVAAGLAVTVVGIVGGGGGWSHYLIGPAVWTAIGAGLAARWILTKVAVAAVLISCIVAVATAVHAGPTRNYVHARAIGLAIHHAAQPGDTAVTLYGVADIQLYTGLDAPYPYLWSLPMRVRDPRLKQLIAVVSGPAAPTWIVQTNGGVFHGANRAALGALVASRYREVSHACGSRIWLLASQQRSIPDHFPCR